MPADKVDRVYVERTYFLGPDKGGDRAYHLLAEALRANSFEVTAAIFGGERALPALGFHAAAISAQEISREATLYMDFIKAFNRDSASTPVLEYIILPAKDEKGLANLDRWYQRDDGTVLGSFRVYKLVLRP